MVLWVTTIILPSFLETNCPAKPHSYRPVCSEGSTKISQNNSWGIFLSSTYHDCLVQHRASGRLRHVTASGGTSYLEKISTQLALPVGGGAQRGIYQHPPFPPPQLADGRAQHQHPSGHRHRTDLKCRIAASPWHRSNHLMWFPARRFQITNHGNILSPVAELYRCE